jgi:hypothetical protein
MALSDVARSWLINLPVGSIYNWDQLCAMFIKNFQGMYERPSTTETLKTIRQKHDESLQDYVKCFCNTRNAIPYVQDNEIINAFRDGVSNIKTMEEITMKKTKTCPICSHLRTHASRLPKPRLHFLSPVAGDPRRRCSTIGKSTRLTGEITRIMEITDTVETASSSPQIRRRRDLSVDLTTQRSGARFIVPQDMI